MVYQQFIDVAQDPIPDSRLLSEIQKHVTKISNRGSGLMLVETAGGPHSPVPSGTSQADLYRSLRLPIILVGDHNLGGISITISAYESLRIRGYDIVACALLRNDRYQNESYLGPFFKDRGIFFLHQDRPSPNSRDTPNANEARMVNYYKHESQNPDVHTLVRWLLDKHHERVERLQSMPLEAKRRIWYPFTQHQGLEAERITTIDSACEDYFQTLDLDPSANSLLKPSFDGSASWWTQGLGHANPNLALSAAYAAGRYGHVMFAEAIHEPALALSEALIHGLNNRRLQKVFFSDNGSTGMEVAVKMGLRAACVRYGWDHADKDVEILGLQGSYHGDTMGAMDMSEPSTYNKKVEWYRGRGFWFDYPKVKMRQGKWIVEKPAQLQEQLGSDTSFNTLDEVFDLKNRILANDGGAYERYIHGTIMDLVKTQSRRFGALVMEPVVLGAGGMHLVDPLFQRTLANVVRQNASLFSGKAEPLRSKDQDPNDLFSPTIASQKDWSGLPIIHDEVFTGLYRLGRRTSSSFLDVEPDIVCHAKLLTGGLVPLCTTLASDSIYESFLSPEKSEALLHGHSYTAHPIGCQVALDSFKTMMKISDGPKWDAFRSDWGVEQPQDLKPEMSVSHGASSTQEIGVWSCWSQEFVRNLSFSPNVDGVWALGSVLAITIKDEEGGSGKHLFHLPLDLSSMVETVTNRLIRCARRVHVQRSKSPPSTPTRRHLLFLLHRHKQQQQQRQGRRGAVRMEHALPNARQRTLPDGVADFRRGERAPVGRIRGEGIAGMKNKFSRKKSVAFLRPRGMANISGLFLFPPPF